MSLKVLFVHHCADVGGAGMSLYYLIKGLEKYGVQANVFFNAESGTLTDFFEKENIPAYFDSSIGTYGHAYGAKDTFFKLFWPWTPITRLLKIIPDAIRFRNWLKGKDFDIIHINSMVQLAAAIGAKLAGFKVVWHIREELHPGTLGLRKFLVRQCVKRCADYRIVISNHNARQLKITKSTSVIYNYVDFNIFDKDIQSNYFRKKFKIRHAAPVVTSLGGMVAHKGTDTFLKAAVEVLKKQPDCRFIIAGEKPGLGYSKTLWKKKARKFLETCGILPNTYRKCLKIIAQHKLREKVFFTGVLNQEIPALLSESNVLVWPANTSHFSRPIIEAGAMKRPVVASRFKSSEEVVSEGETGYLVPNNQPEEFAIAICKLISDPGMANSMGDKAYKVAWKRYNFTQNTQLIFDIYSKITEKDEAYSTTHF